MYNKFLQNFPGGENDSELTAKPAAPVYTFHPKMEVWQRIMVTEFEDVMKQFFQLRSKKVKSGALLTIFSSYCQSSIKKKSLARCMKVEPSVSPEDNISLLIHHYFISIVERHCCAVPFIMFRFIPVAVIAIK